MVAEPLVGVSCAVCGGAEQRILCPPREVEAQLEYLRRFHQRRLRDPARAALADRAEFTQGYATSIVACDECGLVFRNPRPPAGAITRAYASDEYGPDRLASLRRTQVALFRLKCRSLRRRLRSGARVIEVGSFVGGFLEAGREAGWEMLGVDPGREVGAFCARFGHRVFPGTLPELARDGSYPPGSVDGVAVWNAFDQLPEPEPVLRAAACLLRPGGLLLLRVPNGECFRRAVGLVRTSPRWAGDRLRAALAWNNLLAFPYLHGYSVRTLDWLLAWHGFRRIEARPDVLSRLADDQTRAWAALEETAVKALCLSAARLSGRTALAPWLDLFYVAAP